MTASPERRYKAFISYRHRPLDMEYAKKLHSRIEHYAVPADLREHTGGKKKLGLVFRDQEELPISNNLSENITSALDNSEYLIVVCSPDTPGSLWVQREISHFIETHDRDHVLAMLIDGAPEESFPPQLTEVRNECGELTGTIEPLAANIVAPDAAKRRRLFRTESLRILASLIGCPYDALYRREQRYKMRRLGAASAAAAVILSSFIGVLLNRNAKIQEQLLISKEKESQALAALSESAFRDNDYRGSLRNALDALPSADDPRPYVPAAEYALSKELYPYDRGNNMRFIQSFEPDTEISATALSRDGSLLVTGGRYGEVCCYNVLSGRMLWSANCSDTVFDLLFLGNDYVAVNDFNTRKVLSAADGSLLWETDEIISSWSSQSGSCMSGGSSGSDLIARQFDLATGMILCEIKIAENTPINLQRMAVSDDGRYGAALVKDIKEESASLYLLDLKDRTSRILETGLPSNSAALDYNLQFTGRNELVVSCSGNQSYLEKISDYKGASVSLYDPASDWNVRFRTMLDFGESVRRAHGLIDNSDYLDYVGCGTEGIVLAAKTRLVMVERGTGVVRWEKDLPGYVKAGIIYKDDSLGLVLSNGVVTLCTSDSGSLSYDVDMGCFSCDCDVFKAAIAGSRYRISRAVVVPDRFRSRACAVSFCEGENLSVFPCPKDLPDDLQIFLSPSGTYFAGISSSDGKSYRVLLFNAEGNTPVSELTVPDVRYSHAVQDRTFVTDDGKVIFAGRVIDPAEGTVVFLSGRDGPSENYRPSDHSCKEPSGGSILTAALSPDGNGGCCLRVFKNGILTGAYPVPIDHSLDTPANPDSFYSGICPAIGGNGYVLTVVQQVLLPESRYGIASLSDGTISEAPYLDPGEEETVALADAQPWIAVQKKDTGAAADPAVPGDNGLVLFDVRTASEVLRFESGLPSSGVVKLLFTNEDKWLLAFTNSGDVLIFDTGSGRQLCRTSVSDKNLRFSASARYDTWLIPEQNRLLIEYDDSMFRESVCISIDTASFEKNGFYTEVEGWLSESGCLLVRPFSDKLYTAPLFSLSDLTSQAEALLADGLPADRDPILSEE